MHTNFREGIFGDVAKRATLDVTREYKTYTGGRDCVARREPPKKYSKLVQNTVFNARWGVSETKSIKPNREVPLKVKHIYGDVGSDPTYESRVRNAKKLKKDAADKERILKGAEEVFKKHSYTDVNYVMINSEIGAHPSWPRTKKLFPTIEQMYRAVLEKREGKHV